MRALKIIALPITTSPGHTGCCGRIESSDFGIKTEATRAARATGAAEATNSLSIPIKLGLAGGFFSLFFIIDTSALSRYLD